MKSADIKVGQDYEVVHYGDRVRARIVDVKRERRKIYSGARWDMMGHYTSGVVVSIQRVLRDGSLGTVQTTTPQQVKRLWSEAEPEHEAKAQARARKEAAAQALRDRGLSASEYYSGDGVTVHLTVEEAEALAARLGAP